MGLIRLKGLLQQGVFVRVNEYKHVCRDIMIVGVVAIFVCLSVKSINKIKIEKIPSHYLLNHSDSALKGAA